ncbi:MAG: ester cyclase [Planctomycetota bacterium]|jgi:ketosteroid isomerase-like protein
MSVEENKEVARRYHDLNPDEVEDILTPDFIGRHSSGWTWNRDNHKDYWSQERDFKDTIHEQIAEGEWVATRFTRTGTHQDRHVEVDAMHFKRFEDGKIAEIWEYFDSKQLEGEE